MENMIDIIKKNDYKKDNDVLTERRKNISNI